MMPGAISQERSIMSKLSLLDLGFFIAETAASPKHVAGLLICQPPAKAGASFAKDLHRDYLTFTDVKAPFNRVIDFSLSAMPHWEDAPSVDLNQHVFYHKLPKGQNDRKALYAFVSALHVPMLDRSRPLWEVHVIDGLADEPGQPKGQGRFGLYQKMHHAYADGVTMARWTAEGLATSPDDMEITPVWTQKHGGYGGRRKHEVGAQRGGRHQHAVSGHWPTGCDAAAGERQTHQKCDCTAVCLQRQNTSDGPGHAGASIHSRGGLAGACKSHSCAHPLHHQPCGVGPWQRSINKHFCRWHNVLTLW